MKRPGMSEAFPHNGQNRGNTKSAARPRARGSAAAIRRSAAATAAPGAPSLDEEDGIVRLDRQFSRNLAERPEQLLA